MKVNIWIKKEDVLSGIITEYYTQVKNLGYDNYIQISISQEEFVQLDDSVVTNKWYKEQYNRNRSAKDQLK